MTKYRTYTITELYLYLKLDIWDQGRIKNWGLVRKVEVKDDNSTVSGYSIGKPLTCYSSFSDARQLGTGLYLLDLQLAKRDVWNRQLVYIAVIAVCKCTMSHIQSIHCLQITNTVEQGAFKKFISDNPAQASMDKRKSPFRAKKTPRVFDASPLNSVRRNH